MATIKGALAKDGYSDAVIQTMLLSRTTGTMAVVQSRWAAWFTWCRDAGVDPLRCTSPELCQYLSTLFEGGKAVGTIKGYLSSISTTIKLSMKRDLFPNERLTRLIQGFGKLRPRLKDTTPKWDLTLVLLALRRPPYEPLCNASRRSLTLKTAFLTQLALAARPGELTKLGRVVRASRLKCSITPMPGATLKSTRPGEVRLMREVTISSLHEITDGDPDEMLLCPVRMLRRYGEVTATLRGDGSALFLPINSAAPRARPVTANTVSAWIKAVIKDAHETLGEADLKLAGRSAHEVRALAASWAEFNNISLTDIMSNCSWKTPTIFSTFYYRNVASYEEAMKVIGPVVAAGSVVRPV